MRGAREPRGRAWGRQARGAAAAAAAAGARQAAAGVGVGVGRAKGEGGGGKRPAALLFVQLAGLLQQHCSSPESAPCKRADVVAPRQRLASGLAPRGCDQPAAPPAAPAAAAGLARAHQSACAPAAAAERGGGGGARARGGGGTRARALSDHVQPSPLAQACPSLSRSLRSRRACLRLAATATASW